MGRAGAHGSDAGGWAGLGKSDSFQTPQNNLAVIEFHAYQEHSLKKKNHKLKSIITVRVCRQVLFLSGSFRLFKEVEAEQQLLTLNY